MRGSGNLREARPREGHERFPHRVCQPCKLCPRRAVGEWTEWRTHRGSPWNRRDLKALSEMKQEPESLLPSLSVYNEAFVGIKRSRRKKEKKGDLSTKTVALQTWIPDLCRRVAQVASGRALRFTVWLIEANTSPC